jgi:hypothetical protein
MACVFHTVMCAIEMRQQPVVLWFPMTGKRRERKQKKSENRVPYVAVSIPNASLVTK